MFQHERIQQIDGCNSEFCQKLSFIVIEQLEPDLRQTYATFYLMISSKDLIEMLQDD